jgi:hypothetical protein
MYTCVRINVRLCDGNPTCDTSALVDIIYTLVLSGEGYKVLDGKRKTTFTDTANTCIVFNVCLSVQMY